MKFECIYLHAATASIVDVTFAEWKNFLSNLPEFANDQINAMYMVADVTV